MSAAQQLIPVPFYEDTVVLVGQDNEPYVAMRAIVENMGLNWASQYTKLKSNPERWGVVIIATPSLGGMQEATCLPLRKLAAWLMGITPSRVSPELRDKIIRYQNECDDALWDYWTKGSATRPGAQPVNQRIAMSRHRLALGKELLRTRDAGMRQMIHQQLEEVSRAMGLPTPAIDSLGYATPTAPDILKPFWTALAYLDGKGVDYNHTNTNHLLAVNLRGLADLLIEHGQPLRFDNALKQALWQSPSPRCLRKNHPVTSRLTGKSTRCWVFEQPATM
ncbi:phage antirepressor N-terminal domain-containing protein [Pseudomonas sp. NPDC079086]|uniref:phage antirepressor N-terminal domain-containing protein n=1 Tax=unclassified Pseudomonas TaxID=196821 RepID=UPI0037CC7116